MKISKEKMTWMSLGCALSLVAGAPAFADDTELLLISPNPGTLPKPNVLFVMDTSGSMTTNESTTDPYDNTQTYTGACDTNNIYWTDVDLLPACGGGNSQWVEKAAFQCDYAAAQVAGIGSFTNTMVQYRSSNGSQPRRWQYIGAGNHTDPIECEADSGTHGDGNPAYLYAANGAGLAYPWTDNPNNELSWGSAPRNLAYTFYDGNYLNWKNSPNTVSLSRQAIMIDVTKRVLSSVRNMNVGIMRFNNNEGGPIIESVKDLDTNRTQILNTVDNLGAAGATPVSEALYEAALYWLGAPAEYGESITEHTTDPLALSQLSPQVYQQPALDSCVKNFNVMITDGEPNNNEDAPGLVPTLPGYFATLGRSDCDGSGDGRCLDDISEYLSKYDADGVTDGVQNVTTHTIGFTVDLDILRDTALESGGRYFLADDVESLTVALLKIVSEINDRTLSFSAPSVSVNTFNRTQNLNDVYLSVFAAREKTRWPGNLKKYKIVNNAIYDDKDLPAVDPMTGFFKSDSRSIWTTGINDGDDVRLGGAAAELPAPNARNLFTNNGGDNNLTAAVNALNASNLAAYGPADFGLLGATGEPTIDELVRWMRGEDVRDEDQNAATTVRNAMGDPLHSSPASVVYGGTPASPEVVVYMATNDGYLHAIDAATGAELWSFVPKELLPNMTRLYFNPSAKWKNYGLDGDIIPVTADRDRDGIIEPADGDFVRLIFGMRRGGSTYYALDVTNKTAPKMLWTRTLDDAGQSWSPPVVTRMDINSVGLNSDKAVVVIGGGYDDSHDTASHPAVADAIGAGIHFLDLETGQTLWRGGRDAGATKVFSGMTRSFPTQIKTIDINGDRITDRMYASDMGGQLWRFDIKRGETPANLVNGGVIAQLGAEGLATTPTLADTRRFYNAPDVSIFRDPVQGQRYIALSIGSGYRSGPFDLSANDRFYSVRDPAIFTQLTQGDYDSYSVVSEANLTEVSGAVKVVVPTSSRGWKFTLPANEKILAESITFNDEVFFVSFTPDNLSAANCSAGRGTNFLYRVAIANGDPVVQNLDTITPGLEDKARKTQLAQGGIAPQPAVLFPSAPAGCTGAACNPPPLMCIGVECGVPGFANEPVRTLWTQDGIE